MATILATIATWLVISAHGVERQLVGPFATVEECRLHAVVTLLQIRALENKGAPATMGGRAWPTDAVEVDCLPGKHPA